MRLTRSMSRCGSSEVRRRLHLPPENDRQIVGGHCFDDRPVKTVRMRQRRDLFEIAHAPIRVLHPQATIESGIAWRSMLTAAAEWSIKVEYAVRAQQACGASHEAYGGGPRR